MKSFFGGSKSEPILRRKPSAPDSRNEQKVKPQEDEDDQASARQDDEQDDDSDQSEEQDGSRNDRSNNRGQNQRSNGKSRPKMPGSAAARKAMEHLTQLTGQTPESISGLTATDDG